MSVEFLTGPGAAIMLGVAFGGYLLSAVLRERSGPGPRVLTLVTSRPGFSTAFGAVLVVAALLVALRLGVLS